MPTTLVWFRNDLRLHDHPALHAAMTRGDVIALFILDEESCATRPLGAASKWWLHHSLASLQQSLQKKGGTLILKHGNSKRILQAMLKETHADALFFNESIEPKARKYDDEIASELSHIAEIKRFAPSLLFPISQIRTGQGGRFKVFTPFWRECLKQSDSIPSPLTKPSAITSPSSLPVSDSLESFQLLPTTPDWASGLRAQWTPGEEHAIERFYHFLDNGLHNYANGRDIPAQDVTSTLSPSLHFGEISPRAIWHHTQTHLKHAAPQYTRQANKFLAEVGWREFSASLLLLFPNFPSKPFKEEFSNFPWVEDDNAFDAWKCGQTGYPIVDAGMRELWQTGTMHNRVRMIVASFLIKDLRIHWRDGEAWFWDTLVDADLASNSCNWQWVAGCGADAAPYFRIFNPILQSKKFDPQGEYIRRYVPELKELSDKDIHAPWEAGGLTLSGAGITLGKDYPHPMVDHAKARDIALKAFKALKQ